jgi:hypothetical protein
MPVRRLVGAFRDLLSRSDDGARAAAEPSVPAVPLASDPPQSWRTHTSLAGPYPRFAVAYPRGWNAVAPDAGELVHIQPGERRGLDLAVTISCNPVAVAGPQGILDAVEQIARARGMELQRSEVQLDRWRQDGWAGSWAWTERSPRSAERAWRLLALGHDQGLVIATVNGERGATVRAQQTTERILASVRLPPADLLSPESFPRALWELLRDRRMPGDPQWDFSDEGHLVAEDATVRLPDLYRAYLLRRDLEAVAAAVDGRPRRKVEAEFAGRRFEDVAARLRVVLRRADAVEALRIVRVVLPGGIVACPVLDSEDTITYIPETEPDRWGVDARALVSRGAASLDRGDGGALVELRDSETDALRGFRIAGGDGYDTGRLLCPLLRARLERALGPSLLVAMPAAGMVLVLRDDDQGRRELHEAATLYFRQRPRPLSDALWRWTEAGLEPLEA